MSRCNDQLEGKAIEITATEVRAGTESRPESIVEIRDLSFRRGERLIFDGVSMSIPKGKVTAIMGPSGSGKTTLLKLIGGQLKPSSGTVHVDGFDVHQLSRKRLFDLRKRMGMLFQAGALLTDLDVYENVAFPLREHTELSEPELRKIVLSKLEAVGLRGARRLFPRELSGGMARRVALARAIALDPMLIMYDEPFAGQDPITLGVLVRLIRSLNDTLQATSIIVSHNVHETAAIADYVYLLSNAQVVGQGTPEDMNTSDSPQVSQFMHGLADGPVNFHYPDDPMVDP